MKISKMMRALELVLCVAMLLSACGGIKKQGQSTADVKKTLPDGYPVTGVDTVLTWWQEPNPTMLSTAGNRGDTPFGELLEKETGIKVEYIHPAQGQTTEQFNLMVSGGSYPDMISYTWKNYPGGPDAALEEGIIQSLNPLLENGLAPALKKHFDENPEDAAQLQSNSGEFFAFPGLSDGDIMGVYSGGFIRKDALDKAGLAVPETLDELEAALYAFKEQGIEVPLHYNPYYTWGDPSLTILSAFNIGNSLYIDGETIKYGPLEPAYKDYITLLRKWYVEGLLDPEFAVENNKRRDSMVVDGQMGITFGTAGSVFGKLLPILKQDPRGFEMVPMPSLTHQKGVKPEFGHQEVTVGGVTAISRDCQEIELAAKLLDYAYTEKGFYTWSFGEEGKTFNMVNGEPVYTDLIMNPDANGGLSIGEALAKYTGTAHQGPHKNSKYYLMQYYNMPEQQDALTTWSNTNMINHRLPLMYPTVEESTEFSAIKTETDTYRGEMVCRFITGEESLDNYDKFIETLKGMKVERMIEIQQLVYDRYLEKVSK